MSREGFNGRLGDGGGHLPAKRNPVRRQEIQEIRTTVAKSIRHRDLSLNRIRHIMEYLLVDRTDDRNIRWLALDSNPEYIFGYRVGGNL